MFAIYIWCHLSKLYILDSVSTWKGFDHSLACWLFLWNDGFVAKLLFFFPQGRKALGKQLGRSYVIKVLHSTVWLKTL